MWETLAQAFCLMLVIEGIIPFINPARWRRMVAMLALIDDKRLRLMGFCSMLAGVALLYLIN